MVLNSLPESAVNPPPPYLKDARKIVQIIGQVSISVSRGEDNKQCQSQIPTWGVGVSHKIDRCITIKIAD